MIKRISLCVLIATLLAGAVSAQEARGTIVGRITDPSGAVVPGATVTVTNTAMGTKTVLTSNAAGLYQALFLIPGIYQVAVDAGGFKRFVRNDIEVRVNDRIEINAALELGVAAETVTVSAETPLLSTATASVGTVVDARRVADLPVSYGNPFELIGLATGAAFTRDARLDRPFEPTHIVGYAMDGTRQNRSDVTLDGVPATSVANPGEVTASYVPPVDAIQEFKVQTVVFDASTGNTEGGVTNIVIKSGTNDLHGTAYYNTMLPSMSANDFFAKASNQARADFSYKRWGGTAGAPVYIPKLYNGKNRTFFFMAYEGIKDSRPRNNGTPTVPTPAMKNGDFSQFATLSNAAAYNIYNPFTRRAAAGGRFQADPFPGNKIPASLFNKVGVNILKYYPDPLQAGNADGTSNYLQPNLPETADYVTYTGRLDQVISEKQRLYVRGSFYDRDSFYNDYFHNLATGNFFQFLSRAAVADHVYGLNASTVLNVRAGFNRFIRVTEGNPLAKGFDITTLGFPKAFADTVPPAAVQFPRIDLTGYQGTGIASEFRPTEVYSLSAMLSRTAGAHFLKMGMEYRDYREVSISYGNDQVGRFIFDGTYVRGPLDNATSAPNSLGQSVASLLLGLPNQSSLVARNDSYAERSPSWGFFLQDDWKVSRKLTLQIGLRWEFEQPMTERFNRSVRGFDANYVQPFQTAVQAAYNRTLSPLLPAQIFTKGGLTFAGINGQPRGLYTTPKKNLMPRFGFAYQLDNKTVVRGGYGIFFGFLGERRGDVNQTGYSRNTTFVATQNNVDFIGSLSNPFPNGVLMPVGPGQGYQTNVGQNITYFDEKPALPYMQRWQLSVQREVGGFLFDLGYIGNRGTNVEISFDSNSTPREYLSTSPVRDNTTNNNLTRNIANPFAGLLPTGAGSGFTGSNIAVAQLLRPYPQFGSVTHSRFDGYSWYHSMQFSVERRFSKGFTLNGNYTFSKFMQATELLNPTDPRPVEVISDLDRPHRVTISGIYEFPFGRGRRFGRGVNPVAARIIGGWQVSGAFVNQSGAPLGNWGNIIFAGNINDLKLPSDQQTWAHWFNNQAAGFEKASANSLVNNIRTFPLRFGFLRGDKTNNFDLSMQKKTNITETKQVVFRMDWLNALNHTVLPGPNLDPTNSQFGRISASTQANYPRRIEFGFHFVF
ncbi:MAG: carboxypeptidase regulatory-like domain-containing protein [Bryobacteraceae bacterium]